MPMRPRFCGYVRGKARVAGVPRFGVTLYHDPTPLTRFAAQIDLSRGESEKAHCAVFREVLTSYKRRIPGKS